MSKFVIPKSDQLNADDLLSGPRTITITKVSGTGAADQPVAVHFEGDDGKPYKPCKSMRRVMIAGWGVDAAQYVGRSMTLYCDPKVVFGGMQDWRNQSEPHEPPVCAAQPRTHRHKS
ncbi:MAG: hypothetical protein IPK75_20025 [Acidobacteria bacterium]|nr:hypothetical protein [Acidobacteriota bacterium]